MRGLIARVRQSLRLAGPERGGLAGGPDLQDLGRPLRVRRIRGSCGGADAVVHAAASSRGKTTPSEGE
jgi:hypothetical protein